MRETASGSQLFKTVSQPSTSNFPLLSGALNISTAPQRIDLHRQIAHKGIKSCSVGFSCRLELTSCYVWTYPLFCRFASCAVLGPRVTHNLAVSLDHSCIRGYILLGAKQTLIIHRPAVHLSSAIPIASAFATSVAQHQTVTIEAAVRNFW